MKWGKHSRQKKWPAEVRKAKRWLSKRRSSLTGGIRKIDGGEYWCASIRAGKIERKCSFSIKRLGEHGAKLAATLLRMCWLIDLECWRPSEENPFALLSYADIFKGNSEYQDSVVDDELSPWLPHHD